MDPIKKLWMFYNWVEDQKEKIEITKNHAYLIGSFINPEAVKKLMGEGNTIQSSEEEFEESPDEGSQFITEDDDIDQPYKAASALQKAGVLFCLNDDDPQNRGRNLMFNAGTAAAYGLGKEGALQAITLNAAKILGVADKTGTLEVGKDANIVISEGDILDMKSSIVTDAFIQGRAVAITSKHKQLYERYKHKYEIK
jgi:imidazolonepropionase-like amidohydrolase